MEGKAQDELGVKTVHLGGQPRKRKTKKDDTSRGERPDASLVPTVSNWALSNEDGWT